MPLCIAIRRRGASQPITRGIVLLIALVCVQIALGVGVIWFGVPILLALLHQSTALAMFLVLLFIDHRILGEGVGQEHSVSAATQLAAT